ncbi:MAG TPA: VWA domain-containing protein [Blastocatellia bacterium]|nr:VWA domain-containing protein [Blastocatellia bacterium]
MTNCELFRVQSRRDVRSLLAGALCVLALAVAVLHCDWTPVAMTQENVVKLDVAVVERDPQAFGSLTKEEFTVYEDGAKQEIGSLSAQESPFSLGIAIDSSGSMRAQLPLMQRVALNVIGQMNPADEAFVAQFKVEPELIQDFTNNQRALANALGAIYTSGATALFDAIVAASDHVHKNGKSRRKALLFITDGLEKNSSFKEDKVITTLIENQAQAYFICLPIDVSPESLLFPGGNKPLDARERLDRLAKASGGQTFSLKTVDEAATIAAKLIGGLRRQYEITYVSTNNKQEDKLRKVKVVVSPKDGRKLNVITRQGYYGPGHKRVVEREEAKKKK